MSSLCVSTGLFSHMHTIWYICISATALQAGQSLWKFYNIYYTIACMYCTPVKIGIAFQDIAILFSINQCVYVYIYIYIYNFSQDWSCPVGWGCRIHWLLLCRGVRPSPPNECPGYDTKQSDGEVPAVLELWGMRSTPSLPSLPGATTPGQSGRGSTLARSGSTW